MIPSLYVAIGGAAGSVLRYWIRQLMAAQSMNFPLATLAVNVAGSFFIGLLFAFFQKHNSLASNQFLFLTTGLMGGFTTFSAFSLEVMNIIQSGRVGAAIFYVALSLFLGLGAVFCGYYTAYT